MNNAGAGRTVFQAVLANSVNGALACSIIGKNMSAYGNTNQVRFGLAELYN
jgi:hypothetical protein